MTPQQAGTWGRVPTQGHATDHGETSLADIGWELGIPSNGDRNAGSGVQGDEGVCAEQAYYSKKIHWDMTSSVPLRGDSMDSGDVGGKMWW